MGFKIGDEVVCIDDSNGHCLTEVVSGLKKGDEYTIMAVLPFDEKFYNVEVDNAHNYNYCSKRFRKVEKQRFTNKLTAKLAKEAQEELKEYNPLEVPKRAYPFVEPFHKLGVAMRVLQSNGLS